MGEYFFFLLVPLALFVGLLALRTWLRSRSEQPWQLRAGGSDDRLKVKFREVETEIAFEKALVEARHKRQASIAAATNALMGKDEDFSLVVFEDFLHALFTEAHTLRGRGAIDLLAPYMRDHVLADLRARAVDGVAGIVVGAMTIEEVRSLEIERRIQARVRFVANYTETKSGVDQSYYVEESWTLSKHADARSRAPEKARVIGCPSCGAPLEKEMATKCRYCDRVPDSEGVDWIVESISEEVRDRRGPMLVGTTEEEGTDSPTVVAADVERQFAELREADSSFSWRDFIGRVGLIFSTFHVAWSSRDLASMRPFLTDALFETQRYWIDAYKAQGLRNVTEQPQIVTVQAARVVRDRHYDSVTVRVFATCIDYTENERGETVGGDRSRHRQYSEYWTLVRSNQARGAPRVDPGCPNCGAPIGTINMAGKCDSCGAKVTAGEFDWVLSRIEQDEVYRG